MIEYAFGNKVQSYFSLYRNTSVLLPKSVFTVFDDFSCLLVVLGFFYSLVNHSVKLLYCSALTLINYFISIVFLGSCCFPLVFRLLPFTFLLLLSYSTCKEFPNFAAVTCEWDFFETGDLWIILDVNMNDLFILNSSMQWNIQNQFCLVLFRGVIRICFILVWKVAGRLKTNYCLLSISAFFNNIHVILCHQHTR